MYEKTRIQKQSTLLHLASRRKALDSQGQFVETESWLRHGRRVGVIPTTEVDGVKRTSFYSSIKGMYRGRVCLERATKNPKKGVVYTAL